MVFYVRSKPLNKAEFSASKEIPIRERLRRQIRAGLHNPLNHLFGNFESSSVSDCDELGHRGVRPASRCVARHASRGHRSLPLGTIRSDPPHRNPPRPQSMNEPNTPKIQINNTAEYRESYANSVQVRVNLWDFFLLFGTLTQTAADQVQIQNFQGIYFSPQQAKALLNILKQNITQYEATFGEIHLEPQNQANVIQ
jgi:hypothetical protein